MKTYLRGVAETMKSFFEMGKSMITFAALVASFLYALFNFAVDTRVEAKTKPIWDHIAQRRAVNEGRWIETNAKLGNLAEGQARIEETNGLILKALLTKEK